MFYREIPPAADFSNLVLSFWEFAVSKNLPGRVQHEIFPDGCVSVIYHRNEELNVCDFILSRLNLESIKVPVYPGDVFWGMRISPAAASSIFGLDSANFKEKDFEKSGNIHLLTANLSQQLADCHSLDQAIEVYESRLRELNFGGSLFFDQKIADALCIIEASKGNIKMAELSRILSLSQRQFERRFKSSAGLTPKQFARCRRIRATAINVIENNNYNWADRAAEIGFSDQSHLTHEIVDVTGRSPSSFAEKVKQINHGNILK
jgi:AraC-like DNA-binding protein